MQMRHFFARGFACLATGTLHARPCNARLLFLHFTTLDLTSTPSRGLPWLCNLEMWDQVLTSTQGEALAAEWSWRGEIAKWGLASCFAWHILGSVSSCFFADVFPYPGCSEYVGSRSEKPCSQVGKSGGSACCLKLKFC